MKKKITLVVIAVLLIISLIVSVSYAYWRHTFVTTSVNKIVSSCFNMEITNEKNSITLDDAYPITDEKGRALTPYSFTITNTCDLFASYTINLEMLEGTTLNSKYIKTMINNEAITNLNTLETTDTSIEGAVESRILFKGSLGSGDSTDYTFRVWMDYDTPNNEESMNKWFQGKITVTAEVSTYSPVENGFTNLAEALLVNEYQTTSLNVAKNKINSKQEVDFSKTAPIIEWQSNILSSTITINFTKADPSVVGSYNIDDYAAKIMFGTDYSFDVTTGYYKLLNTNYYDPENVDYSKQPYYICTSTIVANSANSLQNWDHYSCVTMYKIVSLKSVIPSTITLSGGDSVATKKYVYSAYMMTETELESDKSDKGLYISSDNDGTTYYYRGNVTNNFLKFAGYSWRVIRINGDGSIRLLYNGNNTNATGNELLVGNSMFNSDSYNPTFVGYMHSNTLNSSYADTIKNDNDSTIKYYLDNWYKTYIFDSGYSSYIADSGFCNDRSISPDSPGEVISNTETIYFSPRYRTLNRVPTFNCINSTNDLFTLSGNSKGNGALIYPVGLLTIDEQMFAGSSYGSLNKMSYTYAGVPYWTMSPFDYTSYNVAANMWYIPDNGSMVGRPTVGNIGIRPVINLKADTEISGGIGTKNDPFIVK